MRSVFDWNIGSRSLQLGKRTLLMGILNVTPDSFSDGGKFRDTDQAVQHGLKLFDDGADIVDVGGESTRPGAKIAAQEPEVADVGKTKANPAIKTAHVEAVSEEEELSRVIPVIKLLKEKRPGAVISVDTYKAKVAQASVEAGAEIVNDVSGFRWDPQMEKTLAEIKCGVVLMHSRGRPEDWHGLKPVPDIVALVKRELRDWVDSAQVAGIKRDRIVLDPGLGFGKKLEENYPLLQRFEELRELRYPLLAGISRKSFIGRAVAYHGNDAAVTQRLHGSLAAETVAILKGAHIIRTHEARASLDAARIADLMVM